MFYGLTIIFWKTESTGASHFLPGWHKIALFCYKSLRKEQFTPLHELEAIKSFHSLQTAFNSFMGKFYFIHQVLGVISWLGKVK